MVNKRLNENYYAFGKGKKKQAATKVRCLLRILSIQFFLPNHYTLRSALTISRYRDQIHPGWKGNAIQVYRYL
jgi:hypothetical protein